MDANLKDVEYLRQAILLAEEAERLGNLPIGAVIALDDQVIARGCNSIWHPGLELTRHAEMEALRAVPPHLWLKSRQMTLYTTLEPCVMCAGAILLHRVGRLVFGSTDPWGGAGPCLAALPSYFWDQLALTEWTGPALPGECDPLYARVLEHERSRGEGPPVGIAGA
jgi:tRNA(adenine34) deaminase